LIIPVLRYEEKHKPKTLVKNPAAKRPFRKSSQCQKDNIKVHAKGKYERVWNGGAVATSCRRGNELPGSIICGEILTG
jgi:hypothetical protein